MEEDNRGTIQLSKYPCHTERTKHWGMYAIWLREAVANGELALACPRPLLTLQNPRIAGGALAYHSGSLNCAIVLPGRHAGGGSGRFPLNMKVLIHAYESWKHPLRSIKPQDP